MRGDPVAIVEAAYRLGSSDAEWLGAVLDSLRPCLSGGASLVGYSYDFSDPSEPRLEPVIDRDMPRGWVDAALRAHLQMPHEQRLMLYRSGPCTSTSAVFGQLKARYVVSKQMRESFGVQDFMVITAANPNDVGCSVLVPAAGRVDVSRREVAAWSQVAAHMAAGRRLRASVAQDVATLCDRGEAVLDAGGTVKHATGAAREAPAREALRRAARAIDRARSELRARDADQSIALWRGLVSGQWTLVDHFDSDGRRFMVAVRNPPGTHLSRGLSEVERCVLGFVALGHTYKLVAYELGVSVSTVSVAVSSICRKLGVSGRVELVSVLGRKLAG